MDDTTFSPSGALRDNLVPVHVQGPDGSWTATDVELNLSPGYFAGGHGLYSTPRDYLTFQRALLGNGAVDGTRVLKESTADVNAGPGCTWGYGLLLNTEDIPGRRGAGSGAWAGPRPCSVSTRTSRRRCTPRSDRSRRLSAG